MKTLAVGGGFCVVRAWRLATIPTTQDWSAHPINKVLRAQRATNSHTDAEKHPASAQRLSET